MKEKTRFDLEQEIMGCWNIVDEMKVLIDKWDRITEDEKLNILIGLSSLYQLKFDTMFNTFENCVRRRDFNDYVTEKSVDTFGESC
jgi:hypothetical protein